MTVAYISEFSDMAEDAKGRIMQVAEAGGKTPSQIVTFTSSSVQSIAFNKATRFIEIVCPSAMHYEIDADPTAVVSVSPLLPANTILYKGVSGTKQLKIACLDVA